MTDFHAQGVQGESILILIISSQAEVGHNAVSQLFKLEKNSSQIHSPLATSNSKAQGFIFMVVQKPAHAEL